VLTLLLQILDEGRLTDTKGRTVDFTNTVVILTSNIGAEALLDTTEDAKDKARSQGLVMAQVRAHFAPEFLNRLSAIVIFNSLGVAQLEKIVHKAMRGVKRRLAVQGIRVVMEKSGAQAVLAASYNRSYGARPVERYLESTVVTTLSRMLISGELTSGSLVHIEALDDEDDSLYDSSTPLSKKSRTLRYRVEHSDLPKETEIVDDIEKWENMDE
jgi:ATP-dependent Clp protease ATP-binding subunit ClpB